jgi:hypothetical protein
LPNREQRRRVRGRDASVEALDLMARHEGAHDAVSVDHALIPMVVEGRLGIAGEDGRSSRRQRSSEPSASMARRWQKWPGAETRQQISTWQHDIKKRGFGLGAPEPVFLPCPPPEGKRQILPTFA